MVCHNNPTSFWLCRECNNYLVLEKNKFTSKNIWPEFIYSTLENEMCMESKYGNLFQHCGATGGLIIFVLLFLIIYMSHWSIQDVS